jgi:hypothetical protein
MRNQILARVPFLHESIFLKYKVIYASSKYLKLVLFPSTAREVNNSPQTSIYLKLVLLCAIKFWQVNI